MKRVGTVLVLILGLGFTTACSDTAAPDAASIRLSATMKVAADSLTVTLRITNVSDTTQVLEWGGCPGHSPGDFAIYRDAGLTQRVWKTPGAATCSLALAEMSLVPNESGTIRGFPVAIEGMLGDSIGSGRYYVAVHPHGLTIRPKMGSYDMPVDAKVPVGAVDLTATLR